MSLWDDEDYSYDPSCEFASSPVQNLTKMFECCASPDFCPCNSSFFTSSTVEDHADIIDSCMAESSNGSLSPPPTPWLAAETPARTGHILWDSAIGTSLTPVASSTMGTGAPRRPSYRASGLLPIPFGYDDGEKADDSAEDEAAADLPTTPPAEPSSANEQSAVTTPLGRSMLDLNISQTPKSLVHRRAAQKVVDRTHRMKMVSSRDRRPALSRRRGGVCRPSDDPHGPQTNVNPFVTAAVGSAAARFDLSSFNFGIGGSPQCQHEPTAYMDVLEDSGIDRSSSSASKLSLRQINTARFDEEFHILETVGNGQFGVVYKCVNRMDGCAYAIKKSRFPVAGSSYERNAMNEVYAYSVLGRHAHIVHYYSSWVEDDRVFIQTEYCNGGSLSSLLAECRTDGRRHLAETELKQLTVHIATGLKYIHSHGLVHLDIKPDNILIQRVGGLSTGISMTSAASVYDGSMDEGLGDESIDELDHIVYKIGDLGQVASVLCRSVDEGDCRYLPCELLADQFDDLPKADVFSLALTVLEASSGEDLPPNGPLWHEYRHAGIPNLPHVSAEFNTLLKSMSTFDVKHRPTAASVTQHTALAPFSHKSSTQLRRELCDERMKNDTLTREVEETRRALLELQRQMMSTCPPAPGHRSQRLVGRSCGRSRSLIAF